MSSLFVSFFCLQIDRYSVPIGPILNVLSYVSKPHFKKKTSISACMGLASWILESTATPWKISTVMTLVLPTELLALRIDGRLC